MHQGGESQNVERILLRHIPLYLGTMCKRVADRSEQANEEVDKASLLTFLSIGIQGVDGQDWPALRKSKRFLNELRPVAGKVGHTPDFGCNALSSFEDRVEVILLEEFSSAEG